MNNNLLMNITNKKKYKSKREIKIMKMNKSSIIL